MTPEQKAQQISVGSKVAPIFGYAAVIVGTPLFNLAVAGVLLGIAAGMMSAPIKFKQMFAIVCWSGVPSRISTVLIVVVLFLKSPEDFKSNNPLVFNPGAFLEPNMPSEIDLFAGIVAGPVCAVDYFVDGDRDQGGGRAKVLVAH